MIILCTERLLLRPFRPADLDFLHALHATPEVARWLGDGKPQPGLTQAEDRLARYLRWAQTPDDQPEGIWAIIPRTGAGSRTGDGDRTGNGTGDGTANADDDTAPVGTLLLKELPLSGGGAPSGDLEIGWHLDPQAWGRGHATEAGRAVLEHAWATGAQEVLAVTRPDNAASQAVCERLGLTSRGTTRKYYDAECALFGRTRP